MIVAVRHLWVVASILVRTLRARAWFHVQFFQEQMSPLDGTTRYGDAAIRIVLSSLKRGNFNEET